MIDISFNKSFLIEKETIYIIKAVKSGKIFGDDIFIKKSQTYLEDKYGF